VRPGPADRCPTAALPRLPLSLPHPTADTGPRCHWASPVNRAAPRCPHPAALPCSPARLHCERALLPSTTPPEAILTPWSELSCHTRGPSLPRFPTSARHRTTDLEKTPAPHAAPRPRPSSSSPSSPLPTRPPRWLPPPETPSSSPDSVRAPPSFAIIGELDRTVFLHPN
jgi:hypothetical protein